MQVFWGIQAVFALALAAAWSGPAASALARDICLDCVSIRLGPAITVRGPFPDELDAPFSAIKLRDGSYRGFSANGATYAIDGQSLWDMGGPRRKVMPSGPDGALNECGRWLTSVVELEQKLIGMVHQEANCNYGPNGQTHKSMALAVSNDEGLSWTDLGTILTGTDNPTRGTSTGEGDCTLIDGHDSYLYAYCQRSSDWQDFVIRAPIGDLGDWRKYNGGAWMEPALGGTAQALDFIGTGAAYLEDYDVTAVVATDPWFDGLRLSLSDDKINFTFVIEPLVPIDASEWDRPASTALHAYPRLVDSDTGSSNVTGAMALSYIYVPPGKGFESRYLVYHDVTVIAEQRPQEVQVGLALTRWKNSDDGRLLATATPLADAQARFEQERALGFMLTSEPIHGSATKISECRRPATSGTEVLLATSGTCIAFGFREGPTSGWLFAEPQNNTIPIYRCRDEVSRTWFASNQADCESLGRPDRLLGYGLAK